MVLQNQNIYLKGEITMKTLAERMDEHALWMDEHPNEWELEPEAPYRNPRTYVYFCPTTSMDTIYDAYNEYKQELAYC